MIHYYTQKFWRLHDDILQKQSNDNDSSESCLNIGFLEQEVARKVEKIKGAMKKKPKLQIDQLSSNKLIIYWIWFFKIFQVPQDCEVYLKLFK